MENGVLTYIKMTIEDDSVSNLGSVIYENILGNERFFYKNPD